MRRAINWVYCDPKSRMTIVEVSTESIVNGALRRTRSGPPDFRKASHSWYFQTQLFYRGPSPRTGAATGAIDTWEEKSETGKTYDHHTAYCPRRIRVAGGLRGPPT